LKTTERPLRVSHSPRAAVLVFSKHRKSLHRQDAKTAKKSLHVRLFSVVSVPSVVKSS